MFKAFFTIIATFLILTSCCQIKNHSNLSYSAQDEMINKWIKATISIENRTYIWDTSTFLDDAFRLLHKKQISFARYSQIDDSIHKIYSSATGSAIFLKYKSKRYLITATHVIRDSKSKEMKISPDIYIIPNEDNFNRSTPFNSKLNLMSPWNYVSYKDENIDLAIISLDFNKEYTPFADSLQAAFGYQPININDVDTLGDFRYGQQIMAVGYPFFSDFDEQNKTTESSVNWVSKYLYQPVVTFGRISSISKFRPYFFGDVNVMPGNSGGAIVSNDKLIGVVSKQERRSIEDTSGRSYRDAFYRISYTAIIVRISYLMQMLREDERRVAQWQPPGKSPK